MSATTATAMKALIEAAGLSITVYRDEAPTSAAFPYVVVSEGITVNAESAFNPRDDAEGHVSEQVQVSLYMLRRNATTNAITESYTLPDAITAALHGKRLTTLPTYGGHMRVLGRTRLFEDEDSIVHVPITVEVRRTLARRP